MFAFINAHLILSIFLFLIAEFFAALFGWFIGTFIVSLVTKELKKLNKKEKT